MKIKDIVIIGAGGFGREIQWLIERINKRECVWRLLGYIDDGVEPGTIVDDLPVLGDMEYLVQYEKPLAAACAVGSAKTRKSLVRKAEQNKNICFPNLIDPAAVCSERIWMGRGNLICAGNILTVDITLGDFDIINLDCTVGHDAVLGDFVTVYPSVNISGCVRVGDETELGTGSHIIQGVPIGEHAVIGAGAVVIKEIPAWCTAVGNPAKPIKFSGGGYKGIVIAGASGHGRVIAELADSAGYQKKFFLDDDAELLRIGSVRGDISWAVLHRKECDAVIAIGNPQIRRKIQEYYEEQGVCVVSLIHPEAWVAEDVEIGVGTVVMAGAVIQPGARIGKGAIVNTASSVDHDCKIGDYCHIAVGSHLAGNVRIGNHTWIGAGAAVSNNVAVCDDVMIGAGAVVVRDIVEPGTYVGVPAKRLG